VEAYQKPKSVKALLRKLESDRGQVVKPGDELRVDLLLRLRPSDLYWLEVLSAYYGRKPRDLGAELLAVALGKAAPLTPEAGDDLEERAYVYAQEQRDYSNRQLVAMRQAWAALATINAPDQTSEELRDEE
jgi:hypothetical protein